MKVNLFLIAGLTLLPIQANAQVNVEKPTIEICRPRTRNIVQNVTQYLAYPNNPRCGKDNVIKLQPTNGLNLNRIRKAEFNGSDGKKYTIQNQLTLIIEKR